MNQSLSNFFLVNNISNCYKYQKLHEFNKSKKERIEIFSIFASWLFEGVSWRTNSGGKRIKRDSNPNEDDSVRSLNRSIPKIGNLKYFPLKVLLQIFTAVGGIDLHGLAENSTRFERIARNERYTQKYLAIDHNEYYESKRCEEFLDLFGTEIKAIEVQDYECGLENFCIRNRKNFPSKWPVWKWTFTWFF